MPSAIRNAILMTMLAVVSTSAMAEWVKVGSNAMDTLYIDPGIRWTDRNTTKMWALNDFNTIQRIGEREPFKSEKIEYEYDCKGQEARMLYFTSHTESMAEGSVVDFNVVPTEWAPVTPNTGQEELWKIACGKT
jgi:hypothetical protein